MCIKLLADPICRCNCWAVTSPIVKFLFLSCQVVARKPYLIQTLGLTLKTVAAYFYKVFKTKHTSYGMRMRTKILLINLTIKINFKTEQRT